jgi:type I restriction enzyme R subunit
MSYSYSESQLIQKGAAELLEQLGWQSVFAYNEETLGEAGTLGRKNYKEVLLVRDMKEALSRLNPWITETQKEEAVEMMERHLSTQTLMQINEEKYGYIRDGIPVTRIKPNGETEEVKVKIIDFQEPGNNSFVAVQELNVHGTLYHRRADIVGFVNGLPLLFVELKRNDVDVENAYKENYRDYLDTIPHLFYYNAFVMLSNGVTSKIGTIGSPWEFFNDWKRLVEKDPGNVELATMLRGVCKKENFIDLLENFILYDQSNGHIAKIMARNHQYLGVNQAVEMYRHRQLLHGKLGVFWHTQGSGKSYSMLFLAQKIKRKFEGSPTIVVLTDREELNDQISGTFENCGLLGNTKASWFIASSGKDLEYKLKGNRSFIFTLIQKFNDPKASPIYPDHDIIIMSDEAHRTQNGTFADNMTHLLPTAHRIGFTGTPLFANDNITKRTFGNYISVYDFKRAVDDHATVPLYYENRGERLQELNNPEINEEIITAIEDAELDPSQQAKVEREFAKEIHLLTAEKRLRIIAKDFVRHYSDLWTSGKAMMVCLNKVTCVRMFNYVQEYWADEIAALKLHLTKVIDPQETQELQQKLAWMEQTEMAVVISQEQNEIQTFRKWGLDILPHREKIEKRELDREYKETDSKLRVVFVCAMWLTGFDVKSLSCLYLDKPMKAHTLMQTIARANRVAEGKENGLIIDYVGIVKALRKALADYTTEGGNGGETDPTVDKQELLEYVQETIATTESYLEEKGFKLESLIVSQGFEKLSLLLNAADAMCESLEVRKTFCTYASTIVALWKYLSKEEYSEELKERRDAIVAIYRELQKKRSHADITDLSVAINDIINEHLEISYTVGEEVIEPAKRFDISKIDFDLLGREFERLSHKHLVLKELEELIDQRIASMMTVNPERVNFYEKYQQIIQEYNEEQNRAEIERTFNELMKLSRELNEEEQRYVTEGFENDEQLALYDLLFTKDLTKSDIKKLKEVSVELYHKIKEKLAELDHPFDKPETRAIIDVTIRGILWEGLPDSFLSRLDECRQHIFEYAYNRYNIA